MMLASKAQAFELWSPKGALRTALKKQPTNPLALSTEGFLDIISYSWNRKVFVLNRKITLA